MEAPDENTPVNRFGVSEGPYGRIAYALFGDERPCDGDIECIRATPELLALIEAAKALKPEWLQHDQERRIVGIHNSLRVLAQLAIAFAKSQE